MQKGRVVVITGGAGGMGTELVRRFLANEDTVIATDYNAESLAKLGAAFKAHEGLTTVAADISKEEDCARLAEVARVTSGRVDVLVHCAGHFPIRQFEELTVPEWKQIVDVNLTAAFILTRALLPLMKTAGWGRIINFGSASVYEGVPMQAAYVAAKAGIVGFSRSIARELGQYGITVNVITPGLTLSPPVIKNFSPEFLAEQLKRRTIKRDQQPGDLVGATFFLASPDSDFITGQIVNVDGGKTMY